MPFYLTFQKLIEHSNGEAQLLLLFLMASEAKSLVGTFSSSPLPSPPQEDGVMKASQPAGGYNRKFTTTTTTEKPLQHEQLQQKS
jgi:hypothetical protein